nr:DUF6602 domain-containing protein [Luteibacter rhizovicinus]
MSNVNGKRLLKAMTGHHQQLQSVFSMTSSHKLPGAKGMLREQAVANFMKLWIPKRFSVPNNVFATTRKGDEFPSELDLVIHDGDTGSVWPLDMQSSNSVATWEEIRLVVQVKSTLGEKQFAEACGAVRSIEEFAKNAGTETPLRVLFAYRTAAQFVDLLLEKFTYSSADAFPFDAFILLDHGAYLSDSLKELRIGIGRGLSEEQVKNDGPSQDRIITEDVMQSGIPYGYRAVEGSSSETTLLALAAIATRASAGDEAMQALLAACVHPDYSPIFED